MQACTIPGSKLHYLFHHWCLGTKATWQSLPSSSCSKPSSPAPPFISFKSLSFHVSMLVCIHLNLRSLHLCSLHVPNLWEYRLPFSEYLLQSHRAARPSKRRPLSGWESGKKPAWPPGPHLARYVSASLTPGPGQPTCYPPGLEHVRSLSARTFCENCPKAVECRQPSLARKAEARHGTYKVLFPGL